MHTKYLYPFLFIVMLGCNKNDNEDSTPEEKEPTCRLTKLIQGVNNGAGRDTTFTFEYDNDGKLVRYQWKDSFGLYSHSLTYNAQNQLIKLQPDGGSSTTWFYTPGGQVSELHYITTAIPHKLVFQYGTDSLPTGSKEFWHEGGQWAEHWDNRYTYQNGNIVKVERWTGGVLHSTQFFEYYENIPNTLKNISLLDMNYRGLGSYEDFFYFNRNMIKKMNRGQDGYAFSYTIDSGKVVHSRARSFKPATGDSTGVNTRFYFYECK